MNGPGESDHRLADLEAQAASIGRVIKEQLPPGVGMTLFIFTLGEGGWMTFVSSAERADVVESLREFISRAEGREHQDERVKGIDYIEYHEGGAGGGEITVHLEAGQDARTLFRSISTLLGCNDGGADG